MPVLYKEDMSYEMLFGFMRNRGSQEAAREIIRRIRDLADVDPEAAHVLEDQLRENALRAVAKGIGGPELATIVLETEDIEFPRWAG